MSTDRLTELLWNHLRVTDPPTAAANSAQPGGALRPAAPETVLFGPVEGARPPADLESEGSTGHPGDVTPVLDGSVRLDALPLGHAGSGGGVVTPILNAVPTLAGGVGSPSPVAPGGLQGGVSWGALGTKPAKGLFDSDEESGNDLAADALVADALALAMTQVQGAWASSIGSGSNAQSNAVFVTLADGPGHTVVSHADAGTMIDTAAVLLGTLATTPTDDIDVTVIEGDVRQSIVVDQFNVLADADHVFAAVLSGGAHTLAAAQEVTTGGNAAFNVAAIAADLGLGDVVFIAGDVRETNLIFQTNILLDADSTRFVLGAFGRDGVTLTLEGTQGAVTGGNAQSNEAWIVDVDAGSGLMILGGTYRESFTVDQTNILFDGDVTALLTSILGGNWADAVTLLGHLEALTGGNTQSNAAHLSEEGPAVAAGAGDWLAFAERLANGTATADDLRAMADAAGRPLDVTYIDGSYEAIRIIVQFNLQLDQDTVRTLIAPEAVGTQSDGVLSYEQFVDGGGNIAVNLAYVFDHNGGFDLQVVLGDYIETNVIQQLNVMIDTDQVLGVAQAAASPYAAAHASEIADHGGFAAANGTADMLKAACG